MIDIHKHNAIVQKEKEGIHNLNGRNTNTYTTTEAKSSNNLKDFESKRMSISIPCKALA